MTACAAGLALALCLQLALGGCFRCAEPKSGSMSEAATSATLIERYQRSCLFVDTPDYGRRFDYQLESDSLRWFLVFFYASYFGSKEALLDNDANSSALVQFLARTWDLYKNATISEIWSLLAESDRDRYDLDLMRHVLNFAHQAAFFIRQELRRTNCVWSRFSLRFDRVIRLAFDLKRELQKAFAIGDTSAFLLLANIVFSNPIAISPNISAKNFIEKYYADPKRFLSYDESKIWPSAPGNPFEAPFNVEVELFLRALRHDRVRGFRHDTDNLSGYQHPFPNIRLSQRVQHMENLLDQRQHYFECLQGDQLLYLKPIAFTIASSYAFDDETLRVNVDKIDKIVSVPKRSHLDTALAMALAGMIERHMHPKGVRIDSAQLIRHYRRMIRDPDQIRACMPFMPDVVRHQIESELEKETRSGRRSDIVPDSCASFQ